MEPCDCRYIFNEDSWLPIAEADADKKKSETDEVDYEDFARSCVYMFLKIVKHEGKTRVCSHISVFRHA